MILIPVLCLAMAVLYALDGDLAHGFQFITLFWICCWLKELLDAKNGAGGGE